jgi:hypothetical protein
LDLVGQVLQAPGLPDAIRTTLLQQQSSWYSERTSGAQPHQGHPAHRRTTASFRLGHDSNLLGAPGFTSLTLSLPGQTVDPPARRQLPGPRRPVHPCRPGVGNHQTHHRRRPVASRCGLGAAQPGQRHQGNSQQLQGVVEYSAPLPASANARRAGRCALGWPLGRAGSHVPHQRRCPLPRAGPAGRCAQPTPAVHPRRRVRHTPQPRLARPQPAKQHHFSGHYTGLAATHGCQAATSGALWVQWGARLGVDHPTHPQRPVAASISWPCAPSWVPTPQQATGSSMPSGLPRPTHKATAPCWPTVRRASCAAHPSGLNTCTPLPPVGNCRPGRVATPNIQPAPVQPAKPRALPGTAPRVVIAHNALCKLLLRVIPVTSPRVSLTLHLQHSWL